MKGTGRWRCGKTGLVHQLKPVTEIREITPPPYYRGTVSSAYGVPITKTTVYWRPVCGSRRRKDLRLGRHNPPVTCLACIGGE